MDNLTHGLFGLAVGALRRPDARKLTPTDKAVLLGCVVAAELPDFDYLWPAGNDVLRTLQAHRGPSHALLCAPIVAGLAVLFTRLFFRNARAAPVFGWSILAVVFAHLLPDLWTGWGTRVLWPFSEKRWALDWTGVIDPFVTLPLLAGAVWGWRKRDHWRRAVLVGLSVAALYVGARIGVGQVLENKVRANHPAAVDTRVFPQVVGFTSWRYVVIYPDSYSAGVVSLHDALEEGRTVQKAPNGPLPKHVENVPSVHEAVSWARFPVVRHETDDAGTTRVEIADLRYHMHGEPTLRFVVDVDGDGAVAAARLERGGSARELLERFRASRGVVEK